MQRSTISQSLITLFQICMLAFYMMKKIDHDRDLHDIIFLYLNVAFTSISILLLINQKHYVRYSIIQILYLQLLLIITVESVINFHKEISLVIILVWIMIFENLNSTNYDVSSNSTKVVIQKIISIIYISLRLTLLYSQLTWKILFVWIQVAVVIIVIIISKQQNAKRVTQISVSQQTRQIYTEDTKFKIKQNLKKIYPLRNNASFQIQDSPLIIIPARRDASEGDLTKLGMQWSDGEGTQIFTKIIDQFPVGVAILKFQTNRNPFVEYCNDTMKTLLKFKSHGELLQKISNLKRQTVITRKDQTQMKEAQNIHKTSITKFTSFSQDQNDKNLGMVNRYLKTGSAYHIQLPSKTRQSGFMTDQTKLAQSDSLNDLKNLKNIFMKELHLLSIQIFKPVVQDYLSKLKEIFEIYNIIDGYLQNDDQNERCIEIKLFMSFQNEIPSILLLARDVTHRDHIKLLQSHNKAMSNQLNFVSHEYRTPLSCVITMLEVCLDDEISRKDSSNNNDSIKLLLPETKIKYIQVALQNCRYLSNLSNDLLDLALIKVGKFKLRKQTFDLKEILEGCLDMFKILADKKRIVLKLDYPSQLSKMIFQDNNRVQQVIVNLLGNAFKFTLNGSITIQVTSGNNGQLTICVSDTGVGIKEEDMMNLFVAFGRLDCDENKKLNRQGVGLGLLISNMIIRNLNQQKEGIQFISEYRKGTTFYFDLDCRKSFDEEESWNHESAKLVRKLGNSALKQTPLKNSKTSHQAIEFDYIPSEGSPQQVYFKSSQVSLINMMVLCQCVQILVVDDNQFNIDVLQILLLKRYRIIKLSNILHIDFAISGDMSLTKIRQRFNSKCCKTYKLIFLDIEMPDMSGLQAFELMRELFDKNQIQVPVIACSGYHKDSLKEKCIVIGMQEYLEKPINKKELDRILQEYYF